MTDFTVRPDGYSIILITAHTDRARRWVDEHIHEDAPRLRNGTLPVETRYASEIVDGMLEAGLKGTDRNPIRVAFRMFPDSDVLALFPDLPFNHDGLITSYHTIGEHAGADPKLLEELPRAEPAQYAALLEEIENRPDYAKLTLIPD